jgi:hypothetical protein
MMQLKPSHKITEKEHSEASVLYWLDYEKFRSLPQEQQEILLVLVDADMVWHRVKRWPITVQEVWDYYDQRSENKKE